MTWRLAALAYAIWLGARLAAAVEDGIEAGVVRAAAGRHDV